MKVRWIYHHLIREIQLIPGTDSSPYNGSGKLKSSNIIEHIFHYRPQRSCGQGYVFTRVCDSVHGGSLRRTPLDQADTPRDQTAPPDQGEPPWDQADTPQDQGEPPRDQGEPPTPVPGRHPPPEEDCSIRSMSGRYASYWNAFLFQHISSECTCVDSFILYGSIVSTPV